MSKPITIQRWAIKADGYAAPELGRNYLVGQLPCGRYVDTSYIKSCEGRVVTTQSGSLYRLGRIHSKFRQFLRDEGFEYNPKQPIPFKRK